MMNRGCVCDVRVAPGTHVHADTRKSGLAPAPHARFTLKRQLLPRLLSIPSPWGADLEPSRTCLAWSAFLLDSPPGPASPAAPRAPGRAVRWC